MARDKEKQRVYNAARYAANREKFRARRAAYYVANREREISKTRAWQVAHPEQVKKVHRSMIAANPERFRAYDRARKGIPAATRPEPPACECCGKPPGRRGMCIDHCHVSGEFRGWICYRCNLGIGMLGDDEKGVVNALRYLQRSHKLTNGEMIWRKPGTN